MTKEGLEAAINSANIWSGRATLVLAIGILGEYALLPFLEKRRWHRPAQILFAMLVVTGIVGEYEFSSQIAQKSAALQRLSDAEVASANSEATGANERVESLQSQNLVLQKQLSQQQEETAKVELDLEKERAKRAPRQLSQKQAQTLVGELKGKIDKLFLVGRGEQEPLQFFDEFVVALKAANLLDTYVYTTSPGENWIGVTLYIPEARSFDEASNDPLVKAFKRAEIPVNSVNWGTSSGVVLDPRLNRNERTIYVGEKPLPN